MSDVSSDQTWAADSVNEYQLPAGASPRHYAISLSPDLKGGTFSGRVRIAISVDRPLDAIVLNADQLNIHEALVNGSPSETRLDPDQERLELLTAVGPGDHQLDITFSGAFNEQLVGFYRSTFTDDDGQQQFLATTQFEATHARKAFPCWDEPAHKAVFEVELLAESEHAAITNTAEIATEIQPDGRVLHRFAPTISMSTYLVAFVVGPLSFSRTVDVDGVRLRVVHVPGGRKHELVDFALESGAFALRYFAEYFGMPYPGDKCDLVAIPDFAFGAMENLGCITFRETLLLIDPETATQPDLERLADVIHHELAHMWFGDLVTMKWWNGLWLNEAFATFMEMRCTDAFRPQWQRWVSFGLSRSAAFDTDGLASTRPIEFEVRSPDEAEGMFDILTYEKGAAVVRMLEQHLGEEPFRDGIRRYMRDNAFGNAETTDLWDAIEAETGEPVRRIMDSWIFQGGFPLITVTISADRRTVQLHQQRFNFAGGDASPEQQWVVPLAYRYPSEDGRSMINERILLEDIETTLRFDHPLDWFVANAHGTSFLRVSYGPEETEQLAEQAQEVMLPVERYALIDDAWAAVQAAEHTASQFLSVIELMTTETDRSVWQRIITGFESIDRLLTGDAANQFAENVHDALAPTLAGLGLTPLPADSDRDRQLRGDLIRAMGLIGRDHEIQEEAFRTMSVVKRDRGLVEAAIVAAATEVVAAIGDDADFDDMVRAMDEAVTPQEELRYLMALADFNEPSLVLGFAEGILTGRVRSQNAGLWLRRALTNRHAGSEIWDFIAQNWDALAALLPSSAVIRMVEGVTSLTEPDQVQAVADFFAEHPIPQATKSLEQILERHRVRASFVEREGDTLNRLLGA